MSSNVTPSVISIVDSERQIVTSIQTNHVEGPLGRGVRAVIMENAIGNNEDSDKEPTLVEEIADSQHQNERQPSVSNNSNYNNDNPQQSSQQPTTIGISL